MTTANRCEAKCGRPARGGVICPGCTHQLGQALRTVPGLRDDLHTALARQSAMGRGVGGRSSETPMAYGVAAGNALRVLDRAMLAAHRWLDPFNIDGPADDCAYLLGRLEELRRHDTAAVAHRRITESVSKARQVVDRPADRWYAGACGFDGDGREEACPAELYVEQGTAYVDCPACGERWDVQTRRNVLTEAARDQLAHASMLAAALTLLDREVPASTVRSWARRRKIVALDVDVKGRPLYRVGDALDVIAATEAAAAAAADTPEMSETSTTLDNVLATVQHSGDGSSATPKPVRSP